MPSFLPLINTCDNFNLLNNQKDLTPFCLSAEPKDRNAPIGLLWPEVVSALQEDNRLARDKGREEPWAFVSNSNGQGVSFVHFNQTLSDRQSR